MKKIMQLALMITLISTKTSSPTTNPLMREPWQKDINSTIKHFEQEKEKHKKELEAIKKELSTLLKERETSARTNPWHLNIAWIPSLTKLRMDLCRISSHLGYESGIIAGFKVSKVCANCHLNRLESRRIKSGLNHNKLHELIFSHCLS